jgi:hypothetical protein
MILNFQNDDLWSGDGIVASVVGVDRSSDQAQVVRRRIRLSVAFQVALVTVVVRDERLTCASGF